MYSFIFVTASHDERILNENLLRSQMVKKHSLLVQKNFKNVAEAYNAVPHYEDTVYIYVHHDVYLPPGFEDQLISSLDNLPSDWLIAGPAGVKLINGKKANFGHIIDRGRHWGQRLEGYEKVQTLDELLLITNGKPLFDEIFAQDFYGADICMMAENRCYAINAFCEHNSERIIGGRTQAFFDAEKAFRFKWFRQLPIVTTCSLLT